MHIHIYVYVGLHVYLYAYVQRPEVNLRCLLILLSTLIFETKSLLTELGAYPLG